MAARKLDAVPTLTRKPKVPLRDRLYLAIQIWYWYVRIRLLLRRETLSAMVERLARNDGARVPSMDPRRLGRIVDRTVPSRIAGATCLTQSLILYRLLRLQGMKPQLVVGLPERATNHEAHAWIELDGKDVGPPPGGRRFTPLARYAAVSVADTVEGPAPQD